MTPSEHDPMTLTPGAARALRNGGIDAVAALDSAMHQALLLAPGIEHEEIKALLGRAMSAVLAETVERAVHDHPELRPDEASWIAIAKQEATRRAGARPAAAHGSAPSPVEPSAGSTSAADEEPLYDVWIDLQFRGGKERETLCAVFGHCRLPKTPAIGETLTFWPPRSETTTFDVIARGGAQARHDVSTLIDEIAHSIAPASEGGKAIVTLRCAPIEVASVEDGRRVASFMKRHHGFEVDPYGGNRLG